MAWMQSLLLLVGFLGLLHAISRLLLGDTPALSWIEGGAGGAMAAYALYHSPGAEQNFSVIFIFLSVLGWVFLMSRFRRRRKAGHPLVRIYLIRETLSKAQQALIFLLPLGNLLLVFLLARRRYNEGLFHLAKESPILMISAACFLLTLFTIQWIYFRHMPTQIFTDRGIWGVSAWGGKLLPWDRIESFYWEGELRLNVKAGSFSELYFVFIPSVHHDAVDKLLRRCVPGAS